MIHNEKQILKQIKDLTLMLGGEFSKSSTLNSIVASLNAILLISPLYINAQSDLLS